MKLSRLLFAVIIIGITAANVILIFQSVDSLITKNASLRAQLEHKDLVITQWKAKWHEVAMWYSQCRAESKEWRLQFFACQKAYSELREATSEIGGE